MKGFTTQEIEDSSLVMQAMMGHGWTLGRAVRALEVTAIVLVSTGEAKLEKLKAKGK